MGDISRLLSLAYIIYAFNFTLPIITENGNFHLCYENEYVGIAVLEDNRVKCAESIQDINKELAVDIRDLNTSQKRELLKMVEDYRKYIRSINKTYKVIEKEKQT